MTNAALANLSREDLMALVAKMAAKGERGVSLKVTKKGGVSMYGLGRFPVTLYGSQWDKLIAAVKSGAVEEFIETNRALLSTKD